MNKNSKNPNRTGQRCIICYSWEVLIENPKPKAAKTRIDHETYCPDYRP